MSDNVFYFRLWLLGAAVLISGMSSCTILSLNTKDKWEKAVANGADPMVVGCALNITSTNSHSEAIICHTLAQNRK